MIDYYLQRKFVRGLATFVLGLLIALALQTAAHAATLSLQPSEETIYTDGFVVDIILNTEGEGISVVEADLTYPKHLIQATNLLYADSEFDYTIKSFRKDGVIEIHRAVVDNSIPNGSNILVAKIAFEFLSNNSPSSIQFSDDSEAFRASDGQPVLSGSSGGQYSYVPPPAPESGATGDPEGSASPGLAGSPAQSNLTATNMDHGDEEHGDNILLDENGNPIATDASTLSQTNPSQTGSGNISSRLVNALVIAGSLALLAGAVYITQKRGLIRLPFLKSTSQPTSDEAALNPDSEPGTVVEPKDKKGQSQPGG